KEKELVSPRHLVADKNALVTKIYAEKGKSVVLHNTYVRKGQVLVSGELGDEKNRELVSATGKVYGLVWYETTVKVPRIQIHRNYTGESYNRSYLVIGKRGLQLTGYHKGKYKQSLSLGEPEMLHFRNWVMPLGWLKEKVMETREDKRVLTDTQAKEMGLRRAREDLLREAGMDSRIAGERILEKKVSSDNLLLRVLYEVEEQISVEQVIVEQMEPKSSKVPAAN
ncbi:MAG: sporulation protein YqfD, partial [Gorillibacterium sp.]|nr:sporulation protein YqfD [Gorillibacterium sp.]